MIVVDTNLLVYAHRSESLEFRRSQRILENAARQGIATTSICVVEFATVVTGKGMAKNPSSAGDCAAFLDLLMRQTAMLILSPSSGFEMRLLVLAESTGIFGRRLHDLAIGLIAHEAGATELWTHDEHFAAPPGLRVRTPLRD